MSDPVVARVLGHSRRLPGAPALLPVFQFAQATRLSRTGVIPTAEERHLHAFLSPANPKPPLLPQGTAAWFFQIVNLKRSLVGLQGTAFLELQIPRMGASR